MRHLWSLVAGVVAAPLTWLLIAIGQGGSTRAVEGWLDANSFETVDLIEPAAYLAAAGVVLGLLATLRVSPLGALVAGVLLAGTYLAMFADPFAVRDAVPGGWELFGDPIPLRLPLTNGTLLLIGALLLMAVFSAQRWRAWPGAAAAAPETVGPPGEPSPDEPAAGPGGPEAEQAEDRDRVAEPAAATPAAPPSAWPNQASPAPAHAAPTTTAANGGADAPGPPPPGTPGSPWSAPPRPPDTGSE